MTGKDLKELIEKLGFPQRKLAEQMGVTPQTISAILTAKDVRTSTIERIASVTNMPVSYFFRENHEANSVVGNGNAAVNGNNNVVVNDNTPVLLERVRMLEKLLDEKERLIKVLMEK